MVVKYGKMWNICCKNTMSYKLVYVWCIFWMRFLELKTLRIVYLVCTTGKGIKLCQMPISVYWKCCVFWKCCGTNPLCHTKCEKDIQSGWKHCAEFRIRLQISWFMDVEYGLNDCTNHEHCTLYLHGEFIKPVFIEYPL